MTRYLLTRARVLLAFLLVPVVVFSNPTQALAATNPWHEVAVTMEIAGYNDDCWTAVQYTGDGLGINVAEGLCRGGPDTTPYHIQPPEPGTWFELVAKGQSASLGVACAAVYNTTLTGHPDDSFTQTAGTIPSGSATALSALGAPTGDCAVTTVCVELSTDDGRGETVYEDCVTVDMGVPNVEAQGSCQYGSLLRIRKVPYVSAVNGQSYFDYKIAANVTTGTTWKFAAAYADGAGSYSGAAGENHGFGVGSYPDGLAGVEHRVLQSAAQPVGFTVWVAAGPNTIDESLFYHLPQKTPGGRMGLTDINACRWYVGLKIAETPSDIKDEPYQDTVDYADTGTPTPTPPTDEDPTAEPSDDVGWLESIFGVLGQLVGAVARIAGAILKGLGDLFIPDPSSWGWEGLVDQVEERPPASVIAGIADGAQGVADGYEASGCGSLADFTSEDISAELTCDQLRSAPGFSALYGVAIAALYAMTGLGLWKMFSAQMEQN